MPAPKPLVAATVALTIGAAAALTIESFYRISFADRLLAYHEGFSIRLSSPDSQSAAWSAGSGDCDGAAAGGCAIAWCAMPAAA